MKNLKAQFKLIICLFIFLNISNIVLTKNSGKFSNAKDISNYFSGILSTHDKQFKKSYTHFKSLNNLEDRHYTFSKYYQYSLISLGRIRDAAIYSKKLNEKKLDDFESNLIRAVYYLKKKDFKNATFYFKKIKNKNQPGTIQNLLSTSLNAWVNFEDMSDLNSALNLLDKIPDRFKGLKEIQKVFAHCYFKSPKTDAMFERLTSNPAINYSRYYFFHSNYLVLINNEKKAAKIIKTSRKKYPNNLLLNQLESDFKSRKIFNNKFNCQNPEDVIAEIFFIVSNSLTEKNNYISSNFYLNLAKYLNPNFVSFDVLYAENFFILKEYDSAKKIFNEMKKKGSDYNWYASKKIASILTQQEKNKDAISSLKKSFKKIINPSIYEIFDYAEFLKNNEMFEDSIKYYSELLNLIGKKNLLYSQVLDSRGIAYERTGQWNKAEVDLLSSLNISPDNAYVINYLAYSWIEQGINIQKSLKMLRKANELRPDDGYIIDSLGWALFKLKKYKEAKEYLELAVRYMASDPVINDHYADALWMNNKSLQARYYWSYVLRLEKTEEVLKKNIEQKLLFGLKS